jgi:hypothetical protein
MLLGGIMDALKKIWDAWKKYGQIIGDFIGRLVLTVFYFTILLPFGIGVRLFGDPLNVKNHLPAKWIAKESKGPNLKEARRLG